MHILGDQKSLDHLWATKLNLARLLLDNSTQTMITAVHQVHLYNNRTYRYTPFPRGEPPSHKVTVCRETLPT